MRKLGMIALSMVGLLGSARCAGELGGGPLKQITGVDAGADAGPVDSGVVRLGLFVAQGMAGRTAVSCDDGRTWVADRSDLPDGRCFVALPDGGPGIDCDHNPGSARGVAYADGAFVATFGWGAAGSIRRSTDGVNWQRVLEGPTFGSLVYAGEGVFVAAARRPYVSTNWGRSFDAGPDVDLSTAEGAIYNVRRAGALAGDGGTVFMFGQDGTRARWAFSRDQGRTWQYPETVPAECVAPQWEGGVVGGNGIAVVVGGNGVACRSVDHGRTWTQSNVGGSIRSELIWAGSEFLVWGADADNRTRLFRSLDGDGWTALPTREMARLEDGGTELRPAPTFLAVARNDDTGTYVAISGSWARWYELQHSYRSTDGQTWEEVGEGAFVGGHPMQHIAFGHVDSSSACP